MRKKKRKPLAPASKRIRNKQVINLTDALQREAGGDASVHLRHGGNGTYTITISREPSDMVAIAKRVISRETGAWPTEMKHEQQLKYGPRAKMLSTKYVAYIIVPDRRYFSISIFPWPGLYEDEQWDRMVPMSRLDALLMEIKDNV